MDEAQIRLCYLSAPVLEQSGERYKHCHVIYHAFTYSSWSRRNSLANSEKVNMFCLFLIVLRVRVVTVYCKISLDELPISTQPRAGKIMLTSFNNP